MRLIDADAFINKIREQNCKECVRRKGIKNGKMRYLYEVGGVPCRACETEDVLNEVDDAPTITPEPHWIPCSEELPKVKQKVLVQYADGSMATKRCNDAGHLAWFYSNAVAWMPAPEPYKGVTT